MSVGLLFLGGLCVAASEFYRSRHNVILSAGIFFVSAGQCVRSVFNGGASPSAEERRGGCSFRLFTCPLVILRKLADSVYTADMTNTLLEKYLLFGKVTDVSYFIFLGLIFCLFSIVAKYSFFKNK